MYSREQLISICERSVVKCYNLDNRDSYSAQVQLEDVYRGLKCGFDFTVQEEIGKLWVYFDLSCNT